MSIELRVLSGARAGHSQSFDKSIVLAGRHPMCDLRLDPEADRDVSARHAEIRAHGDAWLVRDVGSTNGTFVNGERLTGERALGVGDVVALGEFGPRLEVRALAPHALPAATAARSPAPRPAAAFPSPPEMDAAVATYRRVRPTTPAAPRDAIRVEPAARGSVPGPMQTMEERHPTTGERVALAVRESTRGLRRLVAAALALVVVATAAALWTARRGSVARQAEIDALIRRNDSLSAAFDREVHRMSGTVAGLDSALADARAEGQSLRSRLAAAGSDADVAALSAQLARTESRRAALVSAAQMDNTAIARVNGPGVALLAVLMPDGQKYTGTAFGVSAAGLLVTNRHLVRDDQGRVADKLLVKFSGSTQWIPARVARVVDGDDLALLQIDGRGPWPAVLGVGHGSPVVGAPVAIMGYPLGLETAMEGRGSDDFVASATLGVGTTSKALEDVLQIDAFAGEGSSGSPVFDRDGRVVGVVFGGARESAGRIVYAIPAERLLAQLPEAARGR